MRVNRSLVLYVGKELATENDQCSVSMQMVDKKRRVVGENKNDVIR
jgi:hypothetical protein